MCGTLEILPRTAWDWTMKDHGTPDASPSVACACSLSPCHSLPTPFLSLFLPTSKLFTPSDSFQRKPQKEFLQVVCWPLRPKRVLPASSDLNRSHQSATLVCPGAWFPQYQANRTRREPLLTKTPKRALVHRHDE